MVDKQTLTRKEVAAVCGIKPSRVSTWVSLNYLPRPINVQERKNHIWSKPQVEQYLHGKKR